jgi:transcriptional regulator with XRE-family HTH domain
MNQVRVVSGMPSTVGSGCASTLAAVHPPSGAAAMPRIRDVPSPLGDFLRSSRAAVSPHDVGLPDDGRRRVAGLRREEVAVLAGMSVDYYIRLEQGRETGPSAQLITALATALDLDHDGLAHLFRLSGLAPQLPAAAAERVDPALVRLMSAWPDTPALVLGRAYDVLAGNGLGEALFSGFPVTRNLLEKVFLDPASRDFYADWPKAAANTVAGYRLQHGQAPRNPRIRAVLDGLLASSPEFRELWERNRATGKQVEVKSFVHPEVGPLTLRMLTFDVRSAPGQQLVVYQAEDPVSADAVRLLGALVATRAAAGSEQPAG